MVKRKFELNESGTDYFVGDLHGCYDQLMWQLKLVGFDGEVDRLFSVGDLIDRGPDSVKCLELLLKPWFFAVLGNHEAMMIEPSQWHVWHNNGGMWSDMIEDTHLEGLVALVDSEMPLTMEVETPQGTIGIVHADSEPDWNDNGVDSNNLNMWSRTRIRSGHNVDIKNIDMVVCGHTVIDSPQVLGNVLYMDTGAVFDGEMTLMSSAQVHDAIFL